MTYNSVNTRIIPMSHCGLQSRMVEMECTGILKFSIIIEKKPCKKLNWQNNTPAFRQIRVFLKKILRRFG